MSKLRNFSKTPQSQQARHASNVNTSSFSPKLTGFLLGLFMTAAFSASGGTLYVSPTSSNPVPPYTSWATAARAIQDAVDAAVEGDSVVVTNGVYDAAGRIATGTLTNRVVIDKRVHVQSVNGADVTVIQGYQVPGTTNGDAAVRCAYLVDGATLDGFTLTGGGVRTAGLDSDQAGAGVWCESTNAVVLNCIISSNIVVHPLNGSGGGAYSGTFSNCIFYGNVATAGGGAFGSLLVECELFGNRAQLGGGGISTGTALGCVFGGNSAANGGAAANSFLKSCTLTNNSASNGGGGVAVGTLQECILLNNESANTGGGANFSTLNDCTLSGNRAFLYGGGSYASTLTNCLVRTNFARFGGGAHSGVLQNCRLVGNTAYYHGGGASTNTLNSCAVYGNVAVENGGGVSGAVLNNCTVTGNVARRAGGVLHSMLTNSIVYHNRAVSEMNYLGGTFEYCCTVPLPAFGNGNIAEDPQLVDPFHISATSPCITSGGGVGAGRDIDGQSWGLPPSIGCDEPLETEGELAVSVFSEHPNVATGYAVKLTAAVDGFADQNVWDLGDGTWQTNRSFVEHVYPQPGTFSVTVRVSNESHSATDSVLIRVVDAPVHYVALGSQAPVPPYTSWETAATNIQDAVDHAYVGATVLVTNGVYRTGGRPVFGTLTNRVAVTKPLFLKSVHGAKATWIEGEKEPGANTGAAAVRCVYLVDGAVLDGFTITNGATRGNSSGTTPELEMSGGGIWCESTNVFVLNSIVVSNASSHWGSGVFSGTVKISQVVSNWNINNSYSGGGGAGFSVLLDCVVAGNRTGAKSCVLSNCAVYGNHEGTSESTLVGCQVYGNTGTGVSFGSATDSRIFNNVGGAMSASLTNCLVHDNRAFNGGGCNNCLLYSCTVSNNYATNFGGGVYNLKGGTDNLLIRNTAGKAGGGFWQHAALTPVLTNWLFISNTAAGGNGGGLYAESGLLTLEKCVFEGNTATGNGGGAYAASATLKCLNTTFSDNIADGAGGGAYNLHLIGCTLSGNKALTGGGGTAGSIEACNFYTNSAVLKGGGYADPSVTRVVNCQFAGNTAGSGGGFAANGGTLSNCVFTGNSAITNGGGLFCQYSTTVRNSAFSANDAERGGAAYDGTFRDCEFVGNVARSEGGAVFVNFQNSTNCLVSGNIAGLNGGGVRGGTWSQCRFLQNRAEGSGGAAYAASIQNSILANNTATLGGGVAQTPLTQCLLTGNRALNGGAVHNQQMNSVIHCTVVANFATNSGGGIFSSPSGMTVRSSIVYYNSAPLSNNYAGTRNEYCCLSPLPTTGIGNLADEPGVVDLAAGNFRLQPNSPCINAGGGNVGASDLDGRPRVVGARIDIGAYEFQSAGIAEFTHWLQQYGLPTGGVADFADTDLDRLSNWEEWIAGTVPTDAESVLEVMAPTISDAGVVLSWKSVSGRKYVVESASTLSPSAPYSVVQSGIVGNPGVTTFTDTNAPSGSQRFYRVAVE